MNLLQDVLLVRVGDGADDVKLHLLLLGPLLPQHQEEERRHEPAEAYIVVPEGEHQQPLHEATAKDVHVPFEPFSIGVAGVVSHVLQFLSLLLDHSGGFVKARESYRVGEAAGTHTLLPRWFLRHCFAEGASVAR